MEKVIIRNETKSVSMTTAMSFVARMIHRERTQHGGRQYYHIVTGELIVVTCSRNSEDSFTFRVRDAHTIEGEKDE